MLAIKNFKCNNSISSRGSHGKADIYPDDDIRSHWSGVVSDSDTRTTNSQGLATIYSNWKAFPSGFFTLTVDDVSLDGYVYKPSENKETSDSKQA